MVALSGSEKHRRRELRKLIAEQERDDAGRLPTRAREVRECDLASKGRPRADLRRLPGRNGEGLAIVEGRPHQWVSEAAVCPVCGGAPGASLCLRCNHTEIVPADYFRGTLKKNDEINVDCGYVEPPKYPGPRDGLAGGKGRVG